MTEKVNHPKHYGGADNPYEVIKVIEAWDCNFNIGSLIKYVARAGKKPGEDELDDLKKARWFLDREIERRKAPPSETEPTASTEPLSNVAVRVTVNGKMVWILMTHNFHVSYEEVVKAAGFDHSQLFTVSWLSLATGKNGELFPENTVFCPGIERNLTSMEAEGQTREYTSDIAFGVVKTDAA